MKVLWRQRNRDGSTVVELRDYSSDTKQTFERFNVSKDKRAQRSLSCAVPVRQLKQAKKLDCALGVSDEYEVRGAIAYKVFQNRTEKNRWLRAHRWVDHDAGYRDPAPGDFTGR